MKGSMFCVSKAALFCLGCAFTQRFRFTQLVKLKAIVGATRTGIFTSLRWALLYNLPVRCTIDAEA